MIRYHRTEVTLRQTFVQLLDRLARIGRQNGRARQVFWALRGITFTAYPGDVVALIGRNGSGKTTLLKALAGICGADRGQVSVRGTVACLMSFGVGFNPSLSGRENVFLNGSILGLSQRDIKERLDQIIEFAELGDFIDAPVRTYSAGMKGRLGFSIAVVVWSSAVRLGPVIDGSDTERRSLIEHIDAGGNFLWRRGHARILLDAVRQAVMKSVSARHPSWARLSRVERGERLDAALGLTPQQRQALFGERKKWKEKPFVAAISELERIRSSV